MPPLPDISTVAVLVSVPLRNLGASPTSVSVPALVIEPTRNPPLQVTWLPAAKVPVPASIPAENTSGAMAVTEPASARVALLSWSEPLPSSALPLAMVNVPLVRVSAPVSVVVPENDPPPASERVPDATFTAPSVLLTGKSISEVRVPADFSSVPALTKLSPEWPSS